MLIFTRCYAPAQFDEDTKLSFKTTQEVMCTIQSSSIIISVVVVSTAIVSLRFVLVPLSILAIRFFKPRPTETGIHDKIKVRDIQWWWFHVHKFGLYVAIGLSLLGLAVAIAVSRLRTSRDTSAGA